MNQVDMGLTQGQRQGVVDLLNQDLADLYLLLIKTKKYHWDVLGIQFRSLHELWEEQYEALTETVDACAERIRRLGAYPIGTAEAFLKHATLKEHPGDLPNCHEMVRRLMVDHEQIIRNLRQHIDLCSNEFHDEETADFLTGLMGQQKEMAWTLRSFITEESVPQRGSQSADLTGVS
ncbi:MAG: Dps family protein [Cyanobacteria bacterium P01_G01_bin.49]